MPDLLLEESNRDASMQIGKRALWIEQHRANKSTDYDLIEYLGLTDSMPKEHPVR